METKSKITTGNPVSQTIPVNNSSDAAAHVGLSALATVGTGGVEKVEQGTITDKDGQGTLGSFAVPNRSSLDFHLYRAMDKAERQQVMEAVNDFIGEIESKFAPSEQEACEEN